jgi:putative secretion ATPase (PEP-CTERM system associated)
MYESFYGLTAAPFQLSPDHRFFFESSVHRTALAHLTYGLAQGEGFIIVTGEVGAGKTTLVGHLFATLDKQRYVAARVVSTQLGGDDMLRMVAAAFGLPIADASKAALLRQMESFLLANQAMGKRCLLVVDEAQNLSVAALEELRMLSNFQSGAQAPLQSFLLGQPQFRATLASPDLDQLRQRVIASYHLGPLAPGEIRAYVEHRLKAVGWNGDPALSQDLFAAIHAATHGIPRRINTLCSRLFLLGYLEEMHRLDGRHVERVADELRAELDPSATRAVPAAATAARDLPPPAETPPVAEMSDRSADATPRGTADPAEDPRAPITSELVILSERVAMLEAGLAAQRALLDRQERWMLEALGAATALLDLEREAG